jgi:DNA-binding IclR family transcriptional regulator
LRGAPPCRVPPVHRIVDSLRSVGFLEQDARRDRYRLGIKLFELGGTALMKPLLYREAPPFVDTLAKLSGEDVHLCISSIGRAPTQAIALHNGLRDSLP